MLLQPFRRFISENQLFQADSQVLLAVSGGIDSVVMMNLFQQARLLFGVAHCNFQLRGQESLEDEQFVKMLTERINVPFFVTRFDTSEYARKNGLSVQMAARELRYSWFEEIRVAKGFSKVATAHHLDDQVETFFINLIRGTGISGLHGIPISQGNVIRPLLFSTKQMILDYAAEHNLKYRTDSSNKETKYLRNQIRHELIPVITSINPDFTQQLSSTIHKIHDIEVIADQAIQSWKKNIIKQKDRNFFIDVPTFLRSTPLSSLGWELLAPFGFNNSQITGIIKCLGSESSKVFMSDKYRLIVNKLELIIEPKPKNDEGKYYLIRDFLKQKSLKVPLPMIFKKVLYPSGYDIPFSNNIASIDIDKVVFPLILRKWEPGDFFYPFGLNRKKKLSDFFIDQKLSLPDKENCWLLCSGKNIIWVIGHRPDHRFRITKKTSNILQVTLGS